VLGLWPYCDYVTQPCMVGKEDWGPRARIQVGPRACKRVCALLVLASSQPCPNVKAVTPVWLLNMATVTIGILYKGFSLLPASRAIKKALAHVQLLNLATVTRCSVMLGFMPRYSILPRHPVLGQQVATHGEHTLSLCCPILLSISTAENIQGYLLAINWEVVYK
jgi:hypothetical protein